MEWQGPVGCDGPAPSARIGHAMCMIHERGILYMFGGQNDRGEYLNDMYSLNMNTREWKKIVYAEEDRVPKPRSLHSLTPIDRSTLVLFGGDADSGDVVPKALNDVWVFEVKACLWQQVQRSGGEQQDEDPSRPVCRPSPRSHHTAVYNNGADLLGPRVPGIYVFGGHCVGRDKGAVYRLRIETFTWEILSPGVADASSAPLRRSNEAPVPREQHSAVWLPGADGGMVIFCGDGGLEGKPPLSDIWLFSYQPVSNAYGRRTGGQWVWRRLPIKMATNAVENQVPASAGQAVAQFPVDPAKILLWGGVRTRGQGAELAGPATLVDLRRCVSYSVPIGHRGDCQIPVRRVMHTLIPWVDSSGRRIVLLYGGSSVDGNEKFVTSLSPDLELGEVTAGVPASTAAAGNIGNLSRAHFASSGVPSHVNPGQASMRRRVEPSSSAHTSNKSFPIAQDSLDSNFYEALIPRGTPLSGRILDQTEVGHFVSVIINGREYKGVLVCNPRTARAAPAKSAPAQTASPPRDRGGDSIGEVCAGREVCAESSTPDRPTKKSRIESSDGALGTLPEGLIAPNRGGSPDGRRVNAPNGVAAFQQVTNVGTSAPAEEKAPSPYDPSKVDKPAGNPIAAQPKDEPCASSAGIVSAPQPVALLRQSSVESDAAPDLGTELREPALNRPPKSVDSSAVKVDLPERGNSNPSAGADANISADFAKTRANPGPARASGAAEVGTTTVTSKGTGKCAAVEATAVGRVGNQATSAKQSPVENVSHGALVSAMASGAGQALFSSRDGLPSGSGQPRPLGGESRDNAIPVCEEKSSIEKINLAGNASFSHPGETVGTREESTQKGSNVVNTSEKDLLHLAADQNGVFPGAKPVSELGGSNSVPPVSSAVKSNCANPPVKPPCAALPMRPSLVAEEELEGMDLDEVVVPRPSGEQVRVDEGQRPVATEGALTGSPIVKSVPPKAEPVMEPAMMLPDYRGDWTGENEIVVLSD